MSGHVSPKSTYFGIFGALMVLTFLTIAAAFTPLGPFNFPVAIGIAILKGTLVILFFMHVKDSSRLTKMIVAMSFFFLMILFGLTMTDYLSRGWYPSPRGTASGGNTPAPTQNTSPK
jgi:cytochrome c oxidase subunit 4